MNIKPNKKRLNKKRAFTLIELLVVISIIGLLSSVILSSLNDAREKAKIARAQQDMRQIYNAFILYVDKYGHGPKANTGSTSQWIPWNEPMCEGNHTIGSGANDPNSFDRPNQTFIDYYDTELLEFMPEISVDPWGERYVIDAVYNCGTNYGDQVGCKDNPSASDFVYVIYSGGPNRNTSDNTGNNAPAEYEADNVVYQICDHAN